jgi:CTP-dependent riboflavin kinase
LLIKYGAAAPSNPKAKAPASKAKAATIVPPKAKVNERLIPKEYVLQIMDNGHYRPITDEEFDLLKQELPDIAQLFEDEDKIDQL